LIHLLFPAYFGKFKVALAHKILNRVAQKARLIIAASRSTKMDLLRFFPHLEDRIRVIYHGVGEGFCLLSADRVAEFKKNKGLGDFILYVGARRPHKNLNQLLRAYRDICSSFAWMKLVIIGKSDYNSKIKNGETAQQQDSGVIEINGVSEAELPWYYNAATLFCFPSRYEGFGFPPLEAMACGTPVITSRTSSLPEVVGNAAITVNPDDDAGLTAKIYEVLNDTKLRQTLSIGGIKRVREFSWRETARRTMELYRELSEESL
jgi:glycosyltransferase involved in cell wall biosynthesis